MTDIMNGVRILEVAEHTFVPSASAILADWGAEVIKIEHVERGDAMRGLASSGVMKMGGDVHVLPGAFQPRQEEHRARSHETPGDRGRLQARRHVRRVPHQQTPGSPKEAAGRDG